MKERTLSQKSKWLNSLLVYPDLRTAKTEADSGLVRIISLWLKHIEASHLMIFFQFIKRQCFGEDRHRLGEFFARFQMVHQRFGIDLCFHNSWLISGLT